MLSNEQISIVLEEIKRRVYSENISGNLEKTLLNWNISCPFFEKKDIDVSEDVINNPDGKIVIIGGSEMKRNKFEGMVKSKYGLSNTEIQKRFELVLEYEGLNHYNFNKLSKFDYAVILMGPAPHSVKGKGNYSSLITMLEANQENFYPPVHRLSQDAPITKSQVEIALDDLISKGIINL